MNRKGDNMTTSGWVSVLAASTVVNLASGATSSQRHWRKASIGAKPALARSQHWREASIGSKPALARSQHWLEASIGAKPASTYRWHRCKIAYGIDRGR